MFEKNAIRYYKILTIINVVVLSMTSLALFNISEASFHNMCSVAPMPVIKTVYVQPPPKISEPIVINEPPVDVETEVVVSLEAKIDGFVDDICNIYTDIPASLVKSVIYHESTYNPNVLTGDCSGLMQVSTYWHKSRMERLGVTDIFDPYSNILVGVDYLSELYKTHKDMGLVLMLYNMKHDAAFSLHKQGRLSYYAESVMARSRLYE